MKTGFLTGSSKEYSCWSVELSILIILSRVALQFVLKNNILKYVSWFWTISIVFLEHWWMHEFIFDRYLEEMVIIGNENLTLLLQKFSYMVIPECTSFHSCMKLSVCILFYFFTRQLVLNSLRSGKILLTPRHWMGLKNTNFKILKHRIKKEKISQTESTGDYQNSCPLSSEKVVLRFHILWMISCLCFMFIVGELSHL